MAKAAIGPAVNRGHIYTMLVILATGFCDAGYQHFSPSTAAQHASDVSDTAVQKASDAASKTAVIETKVAEHTMELGQIMISVADLKTNVAVIESQGVDAKAAATRESDKLDQVLQAVYRMQGASHVAGAPR